MEEQEDIEIVEDEDLETTDVSSPDEEVEEEEEKPSKRKEWMKSALLILRDIGIALLVVLIVFLILWAYSGVWPPIVVVESSSMQHDDFESYVGVIDTGDLVLVQNTNSPGEVETFVHGQCSDHSTYGDEGDVIVYNERGGGDKPIIHRALIWLEFNASGTTSFNVPGLECDYWENGVNWWASNFNGTNLVDIPEPHGLNNSLTIRVISAYRNFTVEMDIDGLLSQINADNTWTDGGFIALGDNNDAEDASLIKHDWIIGKARGELPWFGLIKLTVTGDFAWGNVCESHGDSFCATENSWNSLIIALIVLIVVPIVLDIGLGFYQRWKARRPQEPDEEETAEEDEEEEASEEPEEEVEEETVIEVEEEQEESL